jgi:hypothetical protein
VGIQALAALAALVALGRVLLEEWVLAVFFINKKLLTFTSYTEQLQLTCLLVAVAAQVAVAIAQIMVVAAQVAVVEPVFVL